MDHGEEILFMVPYHGLYLSSLKESAVKAFTATFWPRHHYVFISINITATTDSHALHCCNEKVTAITAAYNCFGTIYIHLFKYLL